MQFAATNPDADFIGVALGLPSTTNPPCAGCRNDLDLDTQLSWGTPVLQLAIPARTSLVGVRLAVQAFAIGSEP